jgi:haloacetate dehalogenase
MWHKTAPSLSDSFTVITADLRGYGDSMVPVSDENHEAYSKRSMAQDMIYVMNFLWPDTIGAEESPTEWQKITGTG